MNDASTDPAYDIAIIGGGAGGVLVAIQLLRQAIAPLRIALIEPALELARGSAYTTPYAEHLLNVPAQKMSMFNDRADDLLDYLAGDDEAERARLAPAFIERHRYGSYMQQRLQEARANSVARLEIVPHYVRAVTRESGTLRLTLNDDRVLVCKRCVLAVGNRPRQLPVPGAASLTSEGLLSAWDFDGVRAIRADANLCVVGSGLSMVDAVLSFVATGHRGRITVVSRHGLRPLAHAASGVVADFDPAELFTMNLRARVRRVRELVGVAATAGLSWQAVMERLRPHGQSLWRSLSLDDQRRFLRHVVRLWDVHRHRVAGEIDARIQRLIASDQLSFRRARIDAITQAGRHVRVDATCAEGGPAELEVDHVINATGMEMRVDAMGNPLLLQLVDGGYARPGPHGIGLDTDEHSRLLDQHDEAQDDIRVIGSLRIGNLWETIAIPELRGQAEQIARALLGRCQR